MGSEVRQELEFVAKHRAIERGGQSSARIALEGSARCELMCRLPIDCVLKSFAERMLMVFVLAVVDENRPARCASLRRHASGWEQIPRARSGSKIGEKAEEAEASGTGTGEEREEGGSICS